MRSETLAKISKRSVIGAGVTAVAGPAYWGNFPVGGGGFEGAKVLISTFVGGGTQIHDWQRLNPFGGFHTYTADTHLGGPNFITVDWHPVFHAYNLAQGFGVAMGEATLALLAVAGVAVGLGAVDRFRQKRRSQNPNSLR